MRGPFSPPPYPYDKVSQLATLAADLEGGVVDCSVGTPSDPPPPVALDALAHSATERGYPAAAGSEAFLGSASAWIKRRFGVSVDTGCIAPCIGTKELVASVPQLLALRDPSRDTVLYPAVSYPTYAMGALLSGGRAVGIPAKDQGDGGLDLDAISEDDSARALCLWVNSPANPTGELSDLAAAARFGRHHGVPVFSDECYVEFTWQGSPRTVLEDGLEGVVAVHSLSKRSNLAGLRVGFVAGDAELVNHLRLIRRHSGMMVAGPVQAAAAAAWADDEHVVAQRARYKERLKFLVDLFRTHVLSDGDAPVTMPAGGFYVWVPVPRRWPDAWALAEDLAAKGGLVVSPGELYGEAGRGFIRVAAVQPLERLLMVADRLGASSLSRSA